MKHKKHQSSRRSFLRKTLLGGAVISSSPMMLARDYKGGHYDHFNNFFRGVRGEIKIIEDPTFGLRAAGAALLANESYYRGEPVHWDPAAMQFAS